jgi:hypothetical protein
MAAFVVFSFRGVAVACLTIRPLPPAVVQHAPVLVSMEILEGPKNGRASGSGQLDLLPVPVSYDARGVMDAFLFLSIDYSAPLSPLAASRRSYRRAAKQRTTKPEIRLLSPQIDADPRGQESLEQILSARPGLAASMVNADDQ